MQIVKSYLELYPTNNNTFVDIGGHIGTQSLPYSKLFKSVINGVKNEKTIFNLNINAFKNFICR